MADQKLFTEFPPISNEQWLEVVTKDLKGADFDKRLVTKTEDGIAVRPYYRRDNLAPVDTTPNLRRGSKADNGWLTREDVSEPTIDAARTHALRALTRGAEEISFTCYPSGVAITSQADVQKLLEGIFIEMVPLHWQAGPASAQLLAAYANEAERRGVALAELEGSVENDPILDSAAGYSAAAIDDWKASALPVVEYSLKNLPKFTPLVVRGKLLNAAGASAAQELALSVNLLVEYFTGLSDAGVDLNALASKVEIRLGISTNYFLEVAKVRAARILIQNVLDAFGIKGAGPKIHAETSLSTYTIYDPHNNLLRGTTEAMSAAVAGVDSLTVLPFDTLYKTPDEHSEHLSRNIQTLLKEESSLNKVGDPLGGSYYVETLTDSLANAAWALFTKVEKEGGFVAAWKSGTIPAEIERNRQARAKAINGRRNTIVGTSSTPNQKEKRLADVQAAPAAKAFTAPAAAIADLKTALTGGKKISDWSTGTDVSTSPLALARPAAAYEALRFAVEAHEAKGGKRPVVYLAVLGDPKMRKARATFVTGFYAAGGYQVIEPLGFKTTEEAAKAAKEANADIVVVCSSDPEYATLVGPLKKDLAAVGLNARLIVAGAPENADQLKADGADGFANIRQDVVAELKATHAALGIKEVQA